MLEIISTEIPEVRILVTRWFEDERGAFSEVFNHSRWREAGLVCDYAQDAQAVCRPVGTLRGMHFQAPPMAQTKIVRVIHGAVWDVVVDIRVGSPTYGKWVGVELSAANRLQLYVPIGFAHGYLSLEPNTEMIYKLGRPYSPAHERGIAWNDPGLGIQWPLKDLSRVISERDQNWPALSQLTPCFYYDC